MHIEQFDAGRMYFLLSQLAKFADLPPNAWSDHEVAVRKLAKSAKELLVHIEKDFALREMKFQVIKSSQTQDIRPFNTYWMTNEQVTDKLDEQFNKCFKEMNKNNA